jgi:hypothetical protein
MVNWQWKTAMTALSKHALRVRQAQTQPFPSDCLTLNIKTLAFRRFLHRKVSRKGAKAQKIFLNSFASSRLCVRMTVVIMRYQSGFQPTAEPTGLQRVVAPQ